MLSLAAVEYHLVLDGGVVFVGYQTLLFSTQILDGIAQFHVIVNREG